MRSLFISDLHLTPGRPDITRAFLRFLEQDAPYCQALYILGDFFEYWIGDDVMDDFHREIATALKALSAKGIKIFLMHGNRDFMIGQSFCQQAGCTLLPDPSLITLGDEQVLLMHGDSLCTSDTGYIRYRKIIRNPVVQCLLRKLPARFRRNIARKLRMNSMTNTGQKPRSVLDVTPEAVTEIMAASQVKTMVHGHTHRAAIHKLPHESQRIVLGDWDKLGWSLVHDGENFDLSSFPIITQLP